MGILDFVVCEVNDMIDIADWKIFVSWLAMLFGWTLPVLFAFTAWYFRDYDKTYKDIG